MTVLTWGIVIALIVLGMGIGSLLVLAGQWLNKVLDGTCYNHEN